MERDRLAKKTRASDIIKHINPDGVCTVTILDQDYPVVLKDGVHEYYVLDVAKVMTHLNTSMKSPLLYLAIGFPEFTNEFWATLSSLRCLIPNLNIIMVAQCIPPYVHHVSGWFPLPVTGVDYSGDDMVRHRKKVWEIFNENCVTWAEFEAALSNKSRYDFLHTDCKGNLSVCTTMFHQPENNVLHELHGILTQLTQIIEKIKC